LLDVNVHPAKRDIRYSKEDALKKALLETIPNTLRQQNLATVPVSVFSGEKSELSVEKKGLYEQEEEIEQLRLEFQDSTERSIHLEILGVLDATYILCKDNHGGYYVIDQHAAHERVHYEEQLAKIKTSTYAVAPLVPLLVDLTPADKPRMNEALFSLLATVGVQLEWFGDLTLKVVTLPTWALSIGQTYVEDLLQQCFHEPSLNEDKLRLYSIASKACKMSIKAHDYVDTQSLTILLERLLQCQFPYACPHGRPTMIHYSLAQLERLFNRTGF
jgi:DNA mismatch repair protein MutL